MSMGRIKNNFSGYSQYFLTKSTSTYLYSTIMTVEMYYQIQLRTGVGAEIT